MILGEPIEQPTYSLAAHLIGWVYHFSNGVTFGVTYVAMIGNARNRSRLSAVLHWCGAHSTACPGPGDFRRVDGQRLAFAKPPARLRSGRQPGVPPISCRPAFPPAQHLPQVMLQVIDVIDEQPGQGDFGPATDPTGRTPAVLRHAIGDVQEVRVVGPPQVDQVGPLGTLVALDADPLLLLIAEEMLPGGDWPRTKRWWLLIR
jgi:hypothetical protein